MDTLGSFVMATISVTVDARAVSVRLIVRNAKLNIYLYIYVIALAMVWCTYSLNASSLGQAARLLSPLAPPKTNLGLK